MKRHLFVTALVAVIMAFVVWLQHGAAAPLPNGPVGKFQVDFESTDQLPEGWTHEGNVSIDQKSAFKGKHSLVLERGADDVEKPCSLTTATFRLQPGLWQIDLASKSGLKSPDNSFNGVVSLEYLDGAGKVLETVPLVNSFGATNWQPIRRRIEIPEGAAAARFHVQLNKASGRFWVDELSAAFVGAVVKKDHRIDRIMFSTAQMGNLLFPEDKRTVDVIVVATKPLAVNQLMLSYAVRDYWGAEIAAPASITLKPGETQKDGKLQYTTSIDLSGVALEIGRYYEVQAEIAQENDEPFRNYTTLAILPKPVTKQYKPAEVPFTNRNWGSGIPEFTYLGERLGVRTASSADVALRDKLDMGAMFGVGTSAIENHSPGWEKMTDDKLRENVRSSIAKYGKLRPLMLTLGNEPPVIKERLAANVAAYKVVYEEVKKIDPSVIVISTSIGANEAFFEAGFQNHCDVLDFHSYEDWQNIRDTFGTYEKLFAKYGGKKPIWSTEIGLNSHGLARQTVATTMIKKITSFFASGGGNVCWFDLGWPDPDAKIPNDPTSAHNVFDCRYAPRYCPKLDAIAYYNMINGVCVKKPAAEKVYGTDTFAFLFRDRDNHCMQVLWKEKGRQDVMLPLPGVGKVMAIDIDGRRSELDAGGTGLTLTINEDPMLLLYDSENTALPERLGAPQIQFSSMPEGIIKGSASSMEVTLANGVSTENVELVSPAFWKVRKGLIAKNAFGAQVQDVALTAPEVTAAREGNMVVRLTDGKGGYRGELRTRIPVAGQVALRLVPEPMAGDKPASVRLVIENNSAEKQDVAWQLALTGEMPMTKGTFPPLANTNAYFADAAEGTKTIAGKGTVEVVVPLAGIDWLNVYRVKASVTEASGRVVTSERFMAGFLGVPHTKSAIKLDGSMSEDDWKTAPVADLNDARQYLSMNPKAAWKGPSDLSGTLQFLWDEKYLYVGAKVTDDVFVNNKVDVDIWGGDGLQFLIDPSREKSSKAGKYDMAFAITKKGPQGWCYLSADAGAPSGEIKDVVISSKRLSADRGDISYVIAIPWSRVAPFKPGIGANLGLCMVLNEDDGAGRASHLGWFGEIESKSTDCVGDLILGK